MPLAVGTLKRPVNRTTASLPNRWSETIGISKSSRVCPAVKVAIEFADQNARRIALCVTSARCLIVTEVVVMHSSLGVELLAGESQVEPEVGRDRGRRALVGSSVAERRAVPAPDGLVGGVDDDSRGVEVVGVNVEHLEAASGLA